MLSDADIEAMVSSGELVITPFDKKLLRPASYLLTLGTEIAVLTQEHGVTDPTVQETYPELSVIDISNNGYVLEPNQFILASTVEQLGLSHKVGAILRNRSGLSRLGLSAEISSLVSPGFGNKAPFPLTLEIKNFSAYPIRLTAGLSICHCVFFQMLTPSRRGYDTDFGAHSLRVSPSASKFFLTVSG